MAEKRTIDPAVIEILGKAEAEGISTAFSRAESTRPCPIGHEGNCCSNCFMGPCRLTGKTTVGVCGATLETVQARNLARHIAAGAAAHGDHGRNMALTLLALAQGKAPDYKIKDEKKLRKVARLLDVPVEGRTTEEITLDVATVALGEFGRQEGELLYVRRAPPKRQQIWHQLGIAPRGIDREAVETLHRTHMGTDQDAEHLLLQSLCVALSDGWGGSMLATDISDIIFGIPAPVASRSNFGILKENEVNISVHGHEPTLAEMLVVAASDPEIVDHAKSKGAQGINLVGMCCSGNELLVRHGIPIVGNLLQTDLAIATGAIELVVVDYQCIMQGLQS
ncbi:MAG: carbon monoxide dehydrogenase, partial [Dehalococcoidia bacterium]